MAFAFGKSNNENYKFSEMIKEGDASDFIKEMEKEIHDHEYRGHWEVVKRNEIPRDTKTIQPSWSFKPNRFPDRTLKKHKARLCAHGGMQQCKVNYWEILCSSGELD